MKEDKGVVKPTAGNETESVAENGKKKNKEEKPATKVVIRRLPPSMTEEQFKTQVSPLPEIDYFYFVPADKSLTPNAFTRAYINFVNQSDLFIFTQKFDGYVFVDSKGGEFPAVVEFAPFQRIPKIRPNRKKDPKVGTIEADSTFISFKERMEAELLENKTAANVSKQHFFETSLVPEKKEVNNTPLLDYIKNRKAERQRIREEKREEKRKRDLERKRAKDELRRIKIDEDTSVLKKPPPCPENPNLKEDNKSAEGTIVKTSKDNSEKHSFKEVNLIDVTNAEQDVSNKVRELVNMFNKSITENCNNDIKPDFNSFLLNHKDIEKEMVQNTIDKNTGRTESGKYFKTARKLINGHSGPQSKSCYANKPKNMVSSYNTLRVMRTRGDKVVLPHSYLPRNIVVQPIKMERPIVDDKIDLKKDKEDDSVNSDFSVDVFRKNLQKVVVDVLGNSSFKSSSENSINKPKTFIKRASVGSGEHCAKPEFNTASLYLPPRAYGFGQSKSLKSESKSTSYSNDHQRAKLPIIKKTTSVSKRCLSTFSRKSLPPFSNKAISSSKSDGDIEKNYSRYKLGGSEESLKLKHDDKTLEVKQSPVRRPNVGSKRAFFSENISRVKF